MCSKSLPILMLLSALNLMAMGQNKWGFETTVNALLRFDVDTVKSEQLADELNSNTPILLDAREPEEYAVSHLRNARYIGYNHLDDTALAGIPLDASLVVYCSIGKRSEDVARQLRDRGYTDVRNLWGGIFDWTNRGFPVYKQGDAEAKYVHPYSSVWGVWINKLEKSYEPR